MSTYEIYEDYIKGFKMFNKIAVFVSLFISIIYANEQILIVRKNSDTFKNVANNIKESVIHKYKVEDFVLSNDTDLEDFSDAVKSVKPKLMLLMDNKSIAMAINYNKTNPRKEVLGVGVMGLNLKTILKDNKFISGIAFEPPAYSLVTNFRYITKKPVKNILVYYRKSFFSDVVNETSLLLKNEKIKLTSINVEQNGKDKEKIEEFIKKNLAKDVGSKKYDAVWVLLDSGVLTPTLFASTWIAVARTTSVPFLVGLEKFVGSKLSFGVFAITPNLKDLVSQTVQMIDAQLEDEELPEDLGVENLISINKVLNIKKAKSIGLEIQESRIGDVKILE